MSTHICLFLSGFNAHISTDMMRYHKSFVGQDFKLLAQLAEHLWMVVKKKCGN